MPRRPRKPPVAPPSPPPPPPPTSSTPGGPTPRRRSHAGRIAGLVTAGATAVAVFHGLQSPPVQPPAAVASCGGTERWNVKVANDPDVPQVQLTPVTTSIAAMNALTPGPVDQGGRMAVEKQSYTIQGYLAFFKHEDDGDYHVVITDGGDFARQGAAPTGHSMVVELPDPSCFSGKGGKGPQTSPLAQQIAEARAEFEQSTSKLHGEAIAKNSQRVVVTGVAFFDFDHGQAGRGLPHPLLNDQGQKLAKQDKVIELHPVTQITFLDQGEPD